MKGTVKGNILGWAQFRTNLENILFALYVYVWNGVSGRERFDFD